MRRDKDVSYIPKGLVTARAKVALRNPKGANREVLKARSWFFLSLFLGTGFLAGLAGKLPE